MKGLSRMRMDLNTDRAAPPSQTTPGCVKPRSGDLEAVDVGPMVGVQDLIDVSKFLSWPRPIDHALLAPVPASAQLGEGLGKQPLAELQDISHP
jgi:hypothetical protein